ncbi:MAG: GyrI-like domain-containing protein [Proteobacteria bacterium]|nr:GyrI-like domain-containing protein [Pseudomonadota bacterium]
MKKVLKIIGIIVAAFVFLGIAGVVIFIANLPEKSDYAYLQKPRIVQKPDTKAMIVNFDGDPNVVISEAFGSLYKVYYKTAGFSGFFNQTPPIGRYELFDELLEKVEEGDLKSIDWRGYVAIPVSEETSELPEGSGEGAYPVVLGTVEYGTVAEIIHFGSYESEKPTIEKLKAFIENSGYRISGLHEEEYIIGPGLPFFDPEDYITIIRYQVRTF